MLPAKLGGRCDLMGLAFAACVTSFQSLSAVGCNLVVLCRASHVFTRPAGCVAPPCRLHNHEHVTFSTHACQLLLSVCARLLCHPMRCLGLPLDKWTNTWTAAQTAHVRTAVNNQHQVPTATHTGATQQESKLLPGSTVQVCEQLPAVPQLWPGNGAFNAVPVRVCDRAPAHASHSAGSCNTAAAAPHTPPTVLLAATPV